jgi:hypothetical protein
VGTHVRADRLASCWIQRIIGRALCSGPNADMSSRPRRNAEQADRTVLRRLATLRPARRGKRPARDRGGRGACKESRTGYWPNVGTAPTGPAPPVGAVGIGEEGEPFMMRTTLRLVVLASRQAISLASALRTPGSIPDPPTASRAPVRSGQRGVAGGRGDQQGRQRRLVEEQGELGTPGQGGRVASGNRAGIVSVSSRTWLAVRRDPGSRPGEHIPPVDEVGDGCPCVAVAAAGVLRQSGPSGRRVRRRTWQRGG